MNRYWNWMAVGFALCLATYADAQIGFVSVGNYPVGFWPDCVAVADLNGDGRLDIVSANSSGNSLSILTNKGDGRFVAKSTIAVSSPESVTAVDVNGDGRLDLVCANYPNPTVTVLTNKGDANFVLASAPSLGVQPYAITAADVNRDGNADVITANYSSTGSYSVSVLTNNGGGSMVTSAIIGGRPYSIAAADFNGDGNVDLVSAGAGVLTVSMWAWTNGSSVGFWSNRTYSAGSPQSVAVADVNGDGRIDIVTGSGGNVVGVFTNDGAGNFTVASMLIVNDGPSYVATGDMNGDGKVDIIAATVLGNIYTNTSLWILTNDGLGGFSVASRLLVSGPKTAVAVDLNGDGKMDIVAPAVALNKVAVFLQVPVMRFGMSGQDFIVSWASSWTNWTLQEIADVSSSSWQNSSGVLDDGTNKSLTISSQTNNRFFRLYHP